MHDECEAIDFRMRHTCLLSRDVKSIQIRKIAPDIECLFCFLRPETILLDVVDAIYSLTEDLLPFFLCIPTGSRTSREPQIQAVVLEKLVKFLLRKVGLFILSICSDSLSISLRKTNYDIAL